MGLLDVDARILGETIVQHEIRIPGSYEMRLLAKDSDNPSNYLYEQRERSKHPRSTLLDLGYNRLPPVCDAAIIRNRQAVLTRCLEDFPSKKQIYPILNLMHLINAWEGIDRRYHGGHPSLEVAGKFLKRYLQEGEKLIEVLGAGVGSDLFREEKSFLQKLAEEYDRNLPKREIDLILRACNNGAFDSLIIEKAGNDMKVTGVVGDDAPRGVPCENLGRYSFLDQTGWPAGEFVWHGFRKGLEMLNGLFSPIAALYFEAAYVHRRREMGRNVTLPEINEKGIFEMRDGEPIMHTPEPVYARSFSFDKKSARSILNGLHSAGKTHLLCDIPLYIIRGLRGLPVPARYANIPLTKRIFHALSVEKRDGGGSLHAELTKRADELLMARPGDLFLIDEFLQHASPDAAEPLEPIILEAYEKTAATFVIVDHRGESIKDGKKWHFWSPEFKEQGGVISPTYRFKRGKPSTEVLMRHARQLLEKIAREVDFNLKPDKPSERDIDRGPDDSEYDISFGKRIENRVLGGLY